MPSRATINDTYAEAFRSIYAEVLITARDRRWLEHAVNAATGNASSSILCDCEAGLDRFSEAGDDLKTPDGRPGAVLQFHVPRFRKDRAAALEKSLLVRLSQNVLTCPTTACFNLLDEPTYFKLGRKLALFGDGHQFRAVRHGRPVWVVPILSGEFVIDRRFGYRDGLMGGNLWFMGADADAALLAAERGAAGASTVPGVMLPFPGGIAGSGSKAGSRYSFLVASTYAAAPAPAPAPVVATLPVPMTREAAIARARAIRDLVSRGETNGLWADFSPRMRDAVKDSVSYATTSGSIHAQIGAIDSVLSEEVSERDSLIVVKTRCRFQRLPVPGVLTVGFDPAGRIGVMSIRPDAADPREYPSPYLTYEPRTRFELPFKGEWLVFWGGRTLGENYHAASRAQRFALDWLVIFQVLDSHPSLALRLPGPGHAPHGFLDQLRGLALVKFARSLFDHPLEERRQLGLFENLSGLIRLAVAQKDPIRFGIT